MLSAEIATEKTNLNFFALRQLTQESENLNNFSSVLNSHGIPHELGSNGSLTFPELSREQLIDLYLLASLHNQPEVAAWALRDANNIDDIHTGTTITRESVLALKRAIKAFLLGEEVRSGKPLLAEELFEQIAQRISKEPTLSRFLNISSRFTEVLRLVEVATSEDPTEEAIIQVSSLIVSIFITKSLAGSAAASCGIAAAPALPPIGPAIASFSCAAIVGIGIHEIVERVVAVIVEVILEHNPNLQLLKENLNQLFTRFLTDNSSNFERGINFSSSLWGLEQLGSYADTLYSATTRLNQERELLAQANQYQANAGLIMSALWRRVFESQENQILDPHLLLVLLRRLQEEISHLVALEPYLGKEVVIGGLQTLYWDLLNDKGKQISLDIFSNKDTPEEFGAALINWFTKEVVDAATGKVLRLYDQLNLYSPNDEGYQEFYNYVMDTLDKYIKSGLIKEE